MYEDKTLVCKECGNEFVFTAGEQEFYAERGFQNEPQRCKACRDARKNAARGPREYFTAVCAACGGEAEGSLRAQVRSSRLLQRLLRQDEGAGLSHCFDFSESDRLRTVAFLRSVPVVRVRIERMRHVCIFSY